MQQLPGSGSSTRCPLGEGAEAWGQAQTLLVINLPEGASAGHFQGSLTYTRGSREGSSSTLPDLVPTQGWCRSDSVQPVTGTSLAPIPLITLIYWMSLCPPTPITPPRALPDIFPGSGRSWEC